MHYKSYLVVSSDSKYDSVSTIDMLTGETISFDSPSYSSDKLASYSFIQWRNRKMLGKMLTVIDAAISEPRQNKAVKDIIKQSYLEEYGEICDFLFSKLDSPKSFDEVQEVTIDEALGVNK